MPPIIYPQRGTPPADCRLSRVALGAASRMASRLAVERISASDCAPSSPPPPPSDASAGSADRLRITSTGTQRLALAAWVHHVVRMRFFARATTRLIFGSSWARSQPTSGKHLRSEQERHRQTVLDTLRNKRDLALLDELSRWSSRLGSVPSRPPCQGSWPQHAVSRTQDGQAAAPDRGKKKANDAVKSLKNVQGLTGEHQDSAGAAELPRTLGAQAATPPDLIRAARPPSSATRGLRDDRPDANPQRRSPSLTLPVVLG
jgi:hypothetical protein